MPNLSFLKTLFKQSPEVASKRMEVLKDLLYEQKNRMADPSLAYQAIDRVNKAQGTLSPIAESVLTNKHILPTVAGATALGTLANPDSSDAAMLPQVRQLYNNARSQAVKELFHYSRKPEEVVRGGVNPNDYHVSDYGKPAGVLHWTDRPTELSGHIGGGKPEELYRDTKMFINPETHPQPPVVRSVLLPEDKVWETNLSELRNQYKQWADSKAFNPYTPESALGWRDELYNNRGLDWIKLPDDLHPTYNPEYLQLKEHNPMFWENMVRNTEGNVTEIPTETTMLRDRISPRRKALEHFDEYIAAHDPAVAGKPSNIEAIKAKIKSLQEKVSKPDLRLSDLTKYGVGGGIAGSVLLGDQGNADAFPLGKWGKLKPTTEMLPRTEDAFYQMVGHKLDMPVGHIGEKVPTEVVDMVKNPKKDEYLMIVKDAEGNRHQLPMTSDYLHALTSAKGTQRYLEKMKVQGNAENKYQALKSLGIREVKRENTDNVPDPLFRALTYEGRNKVNEIDPNLVHDYSYVQNEAGQTLYMPNAYADLLQRKGHVKILKR